MRVIVLDTTGFDSGENLLPAGVVTQVLARSGNAARNLAVQECFDALVIEARTPASVIPSLAVLRAAPAGDVKLPIMVILPRSQARSIAMLLDSGADEVITDACPQDEMLARLRAVVRRSRGFSSPELRCGPLTFDQRSREARIDGTPLPLTRKEARSLEALILRQGCVLSKSNLLDLIYDSADAPDERALDVIICRLRKKLQAAGAVGLIGTAWGSGYTMHVPGSAAGHVPGHVKGHGPGHAAGRHYGASPIARSAAALPAAA